MQSYPLPWVRKRLHACLDCVDGEHECMFQCAGDSSSKHMLHTSVQVRLVGICISLYWWAAFFSYIMDTSKVETEFI